MAKFSYKVRDMEDLVFEGTIECATSDEAIDRLAERDLIVLAVEELNFDGSQKHSSFLDSFGKGVQRYRNKVPYKDVVFFTRQLATMVGEGVPMPRCLEQLAKGEKKVFKDIIQAVGSDIARGYTFSDAVAKQPGAFNNMFVSVSRAGELSGALDRVLYELADYMENVEAMRSKIKGAMRYPMVISGFISLMVTGILIWLVPMFSNIYASLNAALPLPTRILIFCSNAIRHYFFILVLLAVGVYLFYKYLCTRPEFKYWHDRNFLKIPVFGVTMRKNILANFCRTLALLLESGTPILTAIEMGGAVVGNKFYAKCLEDVYSSLRQGDMLSIALEKTGAFPILVTQLVSTGEVSGKVDGLLRKAAAFYEREIRYTVDNLAAIIEPFLIIIIGAIVGGILLSLYLPVFMIGQFIK